MKTLSGRRAPRCDKDQFRAKITGKYLNRFRDIIVEHRGLIKQERNKNTKNGTFMTAHFCA